jgi:four helix bundle protein
MNNAESQNQERGTSRVARNDKKGAITSHKDLDLWKLSMDLVIELYRITEQFPKEEIYGLRLQIRRAGVSVCSNIAEGAARAHSKEFAQFLYIALGSVSEIETQLEIAKRLGYFVEIESSDEMLTRIRKMLIGLIKHITRNT